MFLLSLFLACIISLQNCNNEKEIAKILECSETEYDFGTVASTSVPLSHTFVLKNISQSDCYIELISTSCSCVTVKYNKKRILPGDTEEITLTFSSQDYSGKFNKSAIVYISNIKNPFALRIKGNISRKEE